MFFFFLLLQTGNVTKRGSQQGKKEVKNITIHIPKDIKLRTSDNAWVSYSRSTTQSQEEEDHNWVIKRVRSILNKLTPENFNALQNQMENITIDTEEKLTGVTDLVFEKVRLFTSACMACTIQRIVRFCCTNLSNKPGIFACFENQHVIFWHFPS